jgi:hypothetical protein
MWNQYGMSAADDLTRAEMIIKRFDSSFRNGVG